MCVKWDIFIHFLFEKRNKVAEEKREKAQSVMNDYAGGGTKTRIQGYERRDELGIYLPRLTVNGNGTK